MHLFQQTQWPFLTLILVLALALEQCTWMKFSVLAERLTSLTALEALLSAVLLSTHMLEYDVKVWKMSVASSLLEIIIVKGNMRFFEQ